MAATIAEMSEAPTEANIDAVNLQISLAQMLDLALRSPEVGAVNFNILYNFLHILLHRINLETTKVEFHGENADQIRKMVTSLKPSPFPLQLAEYNNIDESGIVPLQIQKDDADADVPAEDSQLPTEEISKVTTDLKQEIDLEIVPETQMVVNDAPTALVFKELEQSVKELQRRYQALEELSPEVFESLKDKITLDANEQGIDKITKVVQDIIEGDTSIADTSLINARLDKLEDKVSKMEEWLINRQIVTDVLSESITPTDVAAVEKEEVKEDIKAAAAAAAAAEPTAINDVTLPYSTKEEKEKEISEVANDKIDEQISDKLPYPTKEEKEKEISEVANDKIDEQISDKLASRVFTKKVDGIKELDRLDDVTYTNKQLVTKMKEVETDMEKIGQVIDRMFDDKEKQDKHINTLLEQIELLKIVKANKEDLEDALAEKADAEAIKRKVSHDQFDAACNNLARGLEEAIDKLTKQQLIWQQALDEAQNEIATKMDKDEMTPLKDFVNNKLKSLQEKLKFIIETRREIEAAGTKKLLRDVQCISCDKDVVMKTEEVNRYRAAPLPCTTSLKPYLTYELEKAKKQRRKFPHSRNMNQFEAVMQKEMKKMKAKEAMLARTPKDHLCNRYCGGSHTITTPHQRVLRTGHFLTQWGPEAIQLTDGLIKGKDGQMYHSRPMSGKDVCGPDCWESNISEDTELSECFSTTSRKPLPSQQYSAKNQKSKTQENN